MVFRRPRNLRRLAGLLLLAGSMPAAGRLEASTPPLRRYTTADGLPTNTVTALLADSRGFLWVGTDDGLARFDGERFVLFDDRNGLPPGSVNAVIEHPGGALYVATEHGIVRLAGAPGGAGGRFERLLAPSAEADHADDLAVGPDSSVVAATHGGLFRLPAVSAPPRWERIPLRLPIPDESLQCTFVHADPRGALWTGCTDRLVRIAPDGRADAWDLGPRLTTPVGGMWLYGMREDRRGRRWVAGSSFLWRLSEELRPDRDPVARDYSDCPGGTLRMFDLIRRRDGTLWAATADGPAEVRDDLADEACPLRFLHAGEEDSSHLSVALAEDEAGNLWASESSHGLVRFPAQGFTFFGRDDGVLHEVDAIEEAPSGEVVALAGGPLLVHHGGRFERLDPALPPGVVVGWGTRQRMVFDSRGEFWLGARQGLLRWREAGDLRRIARRPPDRVYTAADGLSGSAIMRLFEDGRGDLWIAPDETVDRQICRWTRGDEAIRCFGEEDGVPASLVRSMDEDAAGQIWIGFRDGTLLRRRGETFERVSGRPDLQPEEITAVLADPTGRLWVAAPRRGLYCLEGLQDPAPRVALYGREAGLSSLDLRSLVQDGAGRIYVGTGRGIDRLDPSTGRVRHYAEQEGLLDASLLSATRAGDGTLWFGTADGIASLAPGPDPAPRPPRVYVMGLKVAGEPRPVSPLGAARLDDLSLGPDQSSVEIEFTGIGHGPGERLAFQTWLEGAESGWSEPSARRSIAYARLASGRYRFHVRAVNADGAASTETAGLAFQVAAPIWRRWWFLALAGTGVLAVGAAFHRQRTARLLDLQRMRMRIATDLHDEVGAGLSEIALMGEVWARQGDSGDGAPRRIAATSRRLVDSMSDIVWAINPEKDHVFSLSQRMRRFATTVLRSAGVRLTFRSIEESEDRALAGDARRELLLAFQEIVTNAAKHARCSAVDVRLEVRGAELVMQVEDDGRGFEPGAAAEGTGLSSLRRRAARLGGVFDVRSGPGAGTLVTLRVPITRHRRDPAGAPP